MNAAVIELRAMRDELRRAGRGIEAMVIQRAVDRLLRRIGKANASGAAESTPPAAPEVVVVQQEGARMQEPNAQAVSPIQAPEDADDFDSPVIRTLVAADGLPIPPAAAKSPASIFQLADRPIRVRAPKNEEPISACYAHLSVASGVTRVAGAAYPIRWTQADHQREVERRQRQRPPRPTKGARTKSKKLRNLIGDDDEA
ncbi:hypothetical protein [Pseudorhodoferax sp. Leaf265]|uniref:hypothetical protein n=1 Tax=Pseudorhodoferax sp. Leaf265 TaxID=1736315 RepID=UPI0006F894C2|nr:hypothetical protein [Pseudorhodoferax sp. Leaf265]KQP02473.1 hypothetical protein ASF45_20685 [Pseudorhodoferax sp. Leaf265]